ncbi:hypothetical protein EJB05_01760, partial [Eragrostis curvula]
MASRGRGYDYGNGDSGAGGKIRRRPASRAAAASPYARPPTAPAPAPATAAKQEGWWFSRLISAGASRLLPSLFGKPPSQLTAPPPPPEPLDETHSLPKGPLESLLQRQDVGPAFLQTQPEPLDAPPSPHPPPLEDDLPDGEENGGAVVNNLSNESSAKDDEGEMLRNSGEQSSLVNLEDLLRQRTFKRQVLQSKICQLKDGMLSEFEYLAELLWSRTIGSDSLKPDNVSIKKIHVSEKEIGSRSSNSPVDFSIQTNSVADLAASPAEVAKAFMGSKSANGSPLRLRLYDPSSLTIKSTEANMIQNAKPPTIPFQGSRLHTLKNSDRFKSNSSTPSRSAIYKMSSSPYFKSAASSEDLFSTVSSPYQTPSSSVHTFGRQVLKRKSTAVDKEIVSVGPIRKMRQKYNRMSPLLETRPGGLDDKARATMFGQAPVQSSEMAAKILKQLDTLVPSQKGGTLEIKQKHGNFMDVETHVSHKKEMSVQSNISEPSISGVKNNSLLNGVKGNDKFNSAALTEKIVDATSNTSASLAAASNSQISPLKEKPATFSLRSHPPNLVLSSEIDPNKISSTSNGFTFPVPAVLGAHSQAPPTPTMASPPILPIEKRQPSAASSASVTSGECGPRISKSVLEEGSVAQKCDTKLNADVQLMSSKSSGQVPSFTSNPVFKFANSKLATLSNGLQHTSSSMAFDQLPANGSIKSASSPSSGSYTILSNSASVSAKNSSTGGSFTISSFGTSSFSAVTGATAQSFVTPSLASSGAGSSSSAPLCFSAQFGMSSSSATQEKSKAVSSSTCFNFSQQFGTASSFAAPDKSKAASADPTFSSGNKFTQNSASNLRFKPSENPTSSNFQSLASPVVSAPLSSPFSASSLFYSAAGSVSTTVSSSAFSASPVFGGKLTANGTAFGLPNNGSATSPSSSIPSAVFSFTAATPSVPNSSPTTPISGGMSPAGQMNGGNLITDKKESPFSTTSPFGIPSNSPSTPIFSSPATQFASTTSASPEIFNFGEQNASSGGFSVGPNGGSERSGRKFIRVKRKK